MELRRELVVLLRFFLTCAHRLLHQTIKKQAAILALAILIQKPAALAPTPPPAEVKATPAPVIADPEITTAPAVRTIEVATVTPTTATAAGLTIPARLSRKHGS